MDEPIVELTADEQSIIDVNTRFKHPTGANSSMYGWVKVPVAFLDEEVPEEAHWSKVAVGESTNVGGFPQFNTRQKTIREYVINFILSNDGEYAIIRLCAMELQSLRQHPVTVSDILDWLRLLPLYGIDVSNVMDYNEVEAMKETEEWSTTVEEI